MKAKLPKNVKDIRIYWPMILVVASIVGLAIIHLIESISISSIFSVIVAWFPLTIILFKPYTVTDNGQLMGNGVIRVSLIREIERKKKGGLNVHYMRKEGGIVRKRSFYPADEQVFINTLLEINPNIKHN